MSEMFDRCTPEEQAIVTKHKEALKPIGARMSELHKYTRPAGKATVSWEQAKAYEDEYVELEAQMAKHNAAIRKIYRKYFKHL
jgi:hypothetical protein